MVWNTELLYNGSSTEIATSGLCNLLLRLEFMITTAFFTPLKLKLHQWFYNELCSWRYDFCGIFQYATRKISD